MTKLHTPLLATVAALALLTSQAQASVILTNSFESPVAANSSTTTNPDG